MIELPVFIDLRFDQPNQLIIILHKTIVAMDKFQKTDKQ
jgi:hypothetical protein